ncbi:hypothetical protein [Armatimonas sp.]|uniref:hypothetical protein n=1 Tax=Armatimonas sp. TaxID=1872638 RepID=UPI0037525A22
MPEADFLTISQASRALGVPERSARRAAERLADNDRQKAANGRTLVKVSALASQMGLPPVAEFGGQLAEELADKCGQDSATVEVLADNGGQPDDGSNHHDGVLIEQLRSENAYLKAQADKWQEQAEKSLQLVDQAQRLQLAAQHRIAELEGKALPAVEQITGSGLPGGDSGEVSSAGGITTPDNEKAPWWAFWRKN